VNVQFRPPGLDGAGVGQLVRLVVPGVRDGHQQDLVGEALPAEILFT
jgi:hypothetical protein